MRPICVCPAIFTGHPYDQSELLPLSHGHTGPYDVVQLPAMCKFRGIYFYMLFVGSNGGSNGSLVGSHRTGVEWG